MYEGGIRQSEFWIKIYNLFLDQRYKTSIREFSYQSCRKTSYWWNVWVQLSNGWGDPWQKKESPCSCLTKGQTAFLSKWGAVTGPGWFLYPRLQYPITQVLIDTEKGFELAIQRSADMLCGRAEHESESHSVCLRLCFFPCLGFHSIGCFSGLDLLSFLVQPLL